MATLGAGGIVVVAEEVAPLSTRRRLRLWLVGCFGFNGPLRQCFSLYRAVSQREGEEKRIDR